MTEDSPSGRPIVAAGTLALLAIVLAGIWFYASQERFWQQGVREQLSSVSALKIQQIVAWNEDRLADCGSIMEDGMIRGLIRTGFGRQEGDAGRSLAAYLGIVARREHYTDVLLVDEAGRILLSLGGGRGEPGEETAAALARAFSDWKPILSDLYRGADGGLRIDAIGPLIDDAGRRRAVILRSNPTTYLFPLIQGWPVPSPTAETLLVRREGNSVLFLNQLRHRPDPPLTFSIPLSGSGLSSAMAAAGARGVVQARDYRGVEVLAALAPVPGTDWYLVAKLDMSEAVAPWRSLALLIVALVAVLVAAALATAGLLWQRVRLGQYRTLYAAEQAQGRAEQELRELNTVLEARVEERTKELQIANAELEAFVGNIAHDLRSPLRSIDGYVGILFEEEAPRLSEAGRGLLGQIRSGARQMGRLTDDLLGFARFGQISLERGRMDMEAIVRSVLEELLTERNGRTIEIRLQPLAPAEGDALLFRQVWYNLLDNALKFSSGSERPSIEIACEKTGTGMRYSVTDNGAGFDMRYRPKLFRVFQRLHGTREFGGTGVGLAIVQRIVERHGGTVDAVGEPGKGATVSFILPAREG